MKEKRIKPGPKPIKIDWDMFDRLCYIQCTLEEIAFGLGCSTDTVERACQRERQMQFAELYKKRSAGGKMSLRRALWKNAVDKGNLGAQIWLSKQHLGMTEKIEEKSHVETDHVFRIGFSDEYDSINPAKENEAPAIDPAIKV